jgi:FAD/FMN-containing dehydrogenase
MSTASPSVLAETAVDGLEVALRGELIEPGDPGYDEARAVYNAMIDRRPRLIVRAKDVADVIAAVGVARSNRLPLAVRGGGHNVAGLGTVEGGILVDLSSMRGVRVDSARRTVRVEGGATWADVDHSTHPFGLAVPCGIISTTGVGGLTLGGGVGHLTRAYGLTCDNLLSADVVLADGRLVTASADEHPDLFWALRGGGGNFGVVTSFEFRAHPAGAVLGGPIFYPIEQTRELMRFYRDFIAAAPDELNAFFGFHIAPAAPFVPEPLQGQTFGTIVACFVGDPERGEELVRPLREFGPPALDLLGPLPMPGLNAMFWLTRNKFSGS